MNFSEWDTGSRRDSGCTYSGRINCAVPQKKVINGSAKNQAFSSQLAFVNFSAVACQF